MLDTYSDLLRSVQAVVGRPEFAPAIPDWIFLVEQELSSALHRREMSQVTETDTRSTVASYGLPDDFGEAITLHLVQTECTTALEASNWDRISELYPVAGVPQAWAITSDTLLLGPTPDGVYTLRFYYYKTIPNLSGVQTSNWVLRDFPTLYYFGVLSKGGVAIGDPRAQAWNAAYQDALRTLIKDQARERSFGGGPKLRADLPFGRGNSFNILTGN